MGSRYIDIAGKRFGKLVVLEKTEIDENRNMRWLCKCDCGNEVVVSGKSLRSGNTKTCGCVRKEKLRKQATTHGKSKTRLYKIWCDMISRCKYPSYPEYDRYGGRGIKVCDEWLHDFQAFYDWAMSHGYADNLTIDRINNDGNYEPSNCQWDTYKHQLNNTSRNHYITYNGETHTLKEWSEITGIKPHTLSSRIVDRKWDIERALTTPPATQYAHH